jgi:hypothetical protein
MATVALPISEAAAQQYPAVNGRQFPLNQMTPPGTYAQWAANVGRTTPEYFQPVKISVPTDGVVTFFEGTAERAHDLAAPAQAGLLVGRVYRLRISQLPEFPGTEFFPSIELVDRLHPPAGKVEEFPIEFELTLDELEWAAAGRLVTKVIYLEQPDRVPTAYLEARERIKTISPSDNAIAEADLLGRPMAIVRIGGRTPDPNQPEPTFFGPGGPVRIVDRNAEPLTDASRNDRTNNRSSSANVGVVRLGKSTARRIAQK